MMRPTQTTADVDTAPPGRATTLVVGGGPIGHGIATELARGGRPVTVVDEDGADGHKDGVEVLQGRVFDGTSLRAVLDEVGDVAAVVAVGSDSEAFLVAHLARLELDDAAIVAFVDDPWRLRAFDGIDVETIGTSAVLADAIRERLREPARV